MRYESGILIGGERDIPCLRAADRQARRAGMRGIADLAGRALLLPGEPFVHMRAVDRPLDLVFCSRRGRIIAVYSDVQPGLRLRGHPLAVCCVELDVGGAARLGLTRGRTLQFQASSSH